MRATTLLILGILCVPAAVAGTADQIQEHVTTLNQAIQDGNEPMRNKMFMEFRLIEQDEPGSVAPVLLKNLDSAVPGVAEYTAFILGWVADKKAIPRLRTMLTGPDGHKRAACQALGNMEAVEALDEIAALLRDPSPRVRQDAAYSLGLLGDPRAKSLLEPAKQDKDELVRFFANEAIERIDNRQKYGW